MREEQYYCMRFYITYRCNSKCHYCNVWQDGQFGSSRELAPGEARELIRQCYEAGVRYIDFTGGEPTLNQNLTELIRYAKSLGIKTEVTTNGISSQKETLRDVAAAADKFNISLDTLNAQTYRKIRGVDCLDRVMETIGELREIRRPKIMTVISGDNAAELDELVHYAQSERAEIYLNPMFSYFGESCGPREDRDLKEGAGGNQEDYIDGIIWKLYEPYTVVMLHFMEFYRNLKSGDRPACSANHRTLTFAPDGALMLPCYHAFSESIPWSGNLHDMLASGLFQRYRTGNAAGQCRNCAVVPYFGISFNYRLDRYFLIQSYSEKLNHLKREFLNQIPEVVQDREKLFLQLQELLRILRSLCVRQTDDGQLYWAAWTGQGYLTDVYRETLTEGQHQRAREAEDCWQLQLVPHDGFDKIYEKVYRKIYGAYTAGEDREEIRELFRQAAEFQLRWWKWYVSKYMRVSITCNLVREASWLAGYLDRLKKWADRRSDEDGAQAVEELLTMITGG